MADLAINKPPAYLGSSEIQKHSHEDDCWIIVHSKVYDVSDFHKEHPGGSNIIMRYAGGDATAAYDEIHAPGIIEDALPRDRFLGLVHESEMKKLNTEENSDSSDRGIDERVQIHPSSNTAISPLPIAPSQAQQGIYTKPLLQSLISTHDFEDVARHLFTKKAFAFYSSAATDLVTHNLNSSYYRQILLRPRVLRNVKEISSNASYPLESIVKAGCPGQPFFLQLYVNTDRDKSAQLLVKARELGIKAIFVTVDAPVPGKREADERIAAENNVVSAISGARAHNDKKGGGMGRLMAKYVDSGLCWEDVRWIRETSGLPVVLKGVQCAMDARLAVEYGVQGIMLSNHGGRSLDTSAPEVFSKLEIYVDGGIMRGTDVVKALALGATAVGIGRPYLYSLAYGAEGVEHLTSILKDELVTSLKLCGVTDIDQLHPGMLNTGAVDHMVLDDGQHPYITWKPKSML
ncbi:hypothetical protein ACEPPN_018619 [Leptodophora sp. 'Broadleaf-Isolate-01']